MRKLETDEKGSLRGPTLQAAILEDKAKGLLPFFVSVADFVLTQACRDTQTDRQTNTITDTQTLQHRLSLSLSHTHTHAHAHTHTHTHTHTPVSYTHLTLPTMAVV